MADFRIDVGFFTHIKTKRLRKRLGLEGVFALQMLWAYAALHEHDESRVYSQEDIELAVDWADDGDITAVLCETGYLDKADGGYKIHQWEIHNGYAATASKRSEAGRIAAKARWDKRLQCDGNADALREHSDGNAPFPIPNPIPNPDPDIKEKPPISPKGDGECENPPAETPKKKRGPKMQAPFQYSEAFESAWSAYPRRERKGAAWAAWEKAIKRGMPVAKMVGIITARKAMHDWAKDNAQFAPHMATWLNQNGWEDEVEIPVSTYDWRKDCAVN